MALDKPSSPFRAKDPNEQLDAMLDEFPAENLGRIEVQLEGKPVKEQVVIVESLLKKRREALGRPEYTSERLHMVERIPDSVFERFLHKQEDQVEVDRGDNGRVFEFVASEDSQQSVVFKMLIREPMPYQNSLLEEGAYQADVEALAGQYADLGVGVPQPYYIASSSRGYVLAMEKLPGKSVKNICKEDVQIPDSLDLDSLESRLQEFVSRLNAAGYYHRDLSEGNIMIDVDAGESSPAAYIIDFGLCIKATGADEAYTGPHGVDGRRDNVMIRSVVDQLRTRRESAGQGASTS